MFTNRSNKISCLSCGKLDKGLPVSILSLWKHSMGTEHHTHPFNAASLWCANSHAYYITGLLLPGLTPLINTRTLCCTWTIYIQHPRQGWSKIPLQSIIHWETFQNTEENEFVCTGWGVGEGANNKQHPLAMQQLICPQWCWIQRAANVQLQISPPMCWACIHRSLCIHFSSSATILFLSRVLKIAGCIVCVCVCVPFLDPGNEVEKKKNKAAEKDTVVYVNEHTVPYLF